MLPPPLGCLQGSQTRRQRRGSLRRPSPCYRQRRLSKRGQQPPEPSAWLWQLPRKRLRLAALPRQQRIQPACGAWLHSPAPSGLSSRRLLSGQLPPRWLSSGRLSSGRLSPRRLCPGHLSSGVQQPGPQPRLLTQTASPTLPTYGLDGGHHPGLMPCPPSLSGSVGPWARLYYFVSSSPHDYFVSSILLIVFYCQPSHFSTFPALPRVHHHRHHGQLVNSPLPHSPIQRARLLSMSLSPLHRCSLSSPRFSSRPNNDRRQQCSAI
ncbi:uncharacterized protein BJ171DRAFT_510960 [Polychytrium aggregatum]|uniref:uncharacterized protein n=1 Tax=Polychytrium aggregatum TaxID=110093 RepID=UPI0022FE2683|nr:uncharacterized protein BJ171DRAFT_510960 [Polychytrium aggregatum]KAI9203136.1 hypothetical protein BJ171DRAFT_510960 [Polychytrium aggregatum]